MDIMFSGGIRIDSLSLITHYLEMQSSETGAIIATGTGFIYNDGNSYYLITNGHNVTRVNPETNQRTSDSIAFPFYIQTSFRVVIDKKLDSGVEMGLKKYQIPIYHDEDATRPCWYIHPVYGYKIDVIAIPLRGILPEIKLFPINDVNFDQDVVLIPSDDVYILGYPP